MSKVSDYFLESYQELTNKTSWPPWRDLQKTAVVVAVAAIIIALLIFAMDKAITAVLNAFYNLF